MIHAICFNRKAFERETFSKILAQTKGKDAGSLTSTVWNCIESFPDGNIYKSFVTEQEMNEKEIVNCQDDIEKFIYVNQYGINKEEEEDMESYENLVQALQQGEINAVEFISKQPEMEEEWNEWLEWKKLEKSEATAIAFMGYKDDMAMNCQNLNY